MSLSENLTSISSENKRAMLAQRLQKEVAKSKISPLSLAQQRLWHLTSQNNTLYNMGIAFCLRGTLEITVLEKSCQTIIQRHEILRTTFSEEALQTVHATVPFKIEISDDVEDTKNQNITTIINQYLIQQIEKPFQLTQEPLLRVSLLKLAATEYLLTMITHHIVCDGWSLGIFCHELSIYYNSFLTGNPATLAPLSIQYRDFVHWQHQYLQGMVLQSHLTYWQSYLQGNISALLLPTDRPQLLSQTYQGRHLHRLVPSYLTAKCKQFCQQEKVTLFMLLLATFKVLLHRYSGQENIIVCVPFSGRENVETEGLIGYFNNVLPIYSDLSHYSDFQNFLKNLRATILEIHQHQALPYQKILEFPNLTHVPLNRALFALQNTPEQPLEFSGLVAEAIDLPKETADFELFLSIVPVADNLKMTLRYKTALFEPTTITQILQHYQCLLEDLITTPRQSLGSGVHCLDHQSMLNKTCVELAEIEVVLCQHPSVQEAVVIVTEEQQLIAYVIPKMTGQTMLIDELKNFLIGKLPNYMLPTYFIKLDSFPLLPNGRINRYRLPVSEQTSSDAPIITGDRLELRLTKIWEKVLKISPIRPQDNFFELGGHSWLAVKLLHQIEESFKVNLSLMSLFQSPTIQQFAEVLRAEGCYESWHLLEVIQPQGAKIPIFFFGTTEFARSLLPWLDAEQPLYGLHVPDFDFLLPRSTVPVIEGIAKNCLQEIQAVQSEGPYYIVGYHDHATIALEAVQQLYLQQQEIASFILLDAFVDDLQRKPYSKLRHHWYNLQELGISYLFYKLQPFFKRLVSIASQSILKLKIRLGLQRQRPTRLTTLSVGVKKLPTTTFQQLLECKLPYQRMALWLSSEWRFQETMELSSLDDFIEGGLKIGEIKGYHHRLFVEPQVKILANQLREYADQVESEFHPR